MHPLCSAKGYFLEECHKNRNHGDNGGWTPLEFWIWHFYMQVDCRKHWRYQPRRLRIYHSLHIAALRGDLEIWDLILNRIEHKLGSLNEPLYVLPPTVQCKWLFSSHKNINHGDNGGWTWLDFPIGHFYEYASWL